MIPRLIEKYIVIIEDLVDLVVRVKISSYSKVKRTFKITI